MVASCFHFPDDAKVRQFTAPHCPKCEVAVSHLKKIGIEFDIVSDASEAISRGYKTVPVLEVEQTSDQFLIYPLRGILNLGGETHD